MNNKFWFFGSKLNTVLLLVLIILMVVALKWMWQDKQKYLPAFQQETSETQQVNQSEIKGETYTYTNHGFSIELPKGFIPHEEQSEGGPVTNISMPKSGDLLVYITNADFWEKNVLYRKDFPICSSKEIQIGDNFFKICHEEEGDVDGISSVDYYWMRKGNIGYQIYGNVNNFLSFKFVGWPVSTELPKYIGTIESGGGWPPLITTSPKVYSCISNTSKEGPSTTEKTINGKKYCITSFIDGGAGSQGGEYLYITKNGSGTKIAKFSLHWVNCGGYGTTGDTQYDECSANQKNFFGNLDSLIDSLMK